MIEQLADLVSRKKVVLFAGAGLSVPLGLPSWSSLIGHMASELGYDPEVLVPEGADHLQIAEFYKGTSIFDRLPCSLAVRRLEEHMTCLGRVWRVGFAGFTGGGLRRLSALTG